MADGMTNRGMTQSAIVAAFDFDGTLTYFDSMLPFLHAVVGTGRFVYHLGRALPTFVAYGSGRLANDVAKERVLMRFLGRRPMAELEAAAQRFARHGIPRLLRRRAMDRFRWHRDQGHRCVLVSASLALYLEPWARAEGFSDVVATRLEVSADGTVTGRFAGGNCYGCEKTRRLDALLGARQNYRLYAYGDSSGDRELLAHADHAYFRRFTEER